MSQGRLCTLFLTVFIFSACGPKEQEQNSNGLKRWASFPVAIYMDSSLEEQPSSETAFHEAMSFWEQKAGRKLFDYRGVWSGQPAYTGDPVSPSSIAANIIFFLNPWNYDYAIAGQTVVLSQRSEIKGSIIMINPNISYCYWSCTSELKVFTHELGHFIGLQHSQDVNDIMYPEIQSGDSLISVKVDHSLLSQLTH